METGCWATLSRCPFAMGPPGPLGALLWGPEVQGSQTGFPTSRVHQLNFGASAVRNQEVPRGVRKEKLEGCSSLLTSPSHPLLILLPGGK